VPKRSNPRSDAAKRTAPPSDAAQRIAREGGEAEVCGAEAAAPASSPAPVRRPPDFEARIERLAERQHGVVTLAQLRELGVTRRMAWRRMQKGRFAAVFRGVYAVGPRLSRHGHEMAAVLHCGPTALLSHRSAARLWGILGDPESRAGRRVRGWGSEHLAESLRGEPHPCEVSVLRSERGHRSPGIRIYRVTELLEADRSEREGIPVTTPERTLLDLAALATRGRGRTRSVSAQTKTGGRGRAAAGFGVPGSPFGPRDLEREVARAEREGLASVDALRARLDARPGWKGARLLRQILDLEGGPAFTRSEAEAMLLARIRNAGLPTPRTNARSGRWELDFFWPAARLAVEVDGFAYHGTRDGFEHDRARDADLAAGGVVVIRVTWRQLQDGPDAVIGTIARALGQAEARARSAAR
jgi:very-short-patch-repair endonuclease